MAFSRIRNSIYNCKQATLLVLKKKEQRLSIAERASLFIHLLFCDPCKRFVKQSDFIDHSLHHCDEMLHDQPVHSLSEETRKKIQQELDSAN